MSKFEKLVSASNRRDWVLATKSQIPSFTLAIDLVNERQVLGTAPHPANVPDKGAKRKSRSVLDKFQMHPAPNNRGRPLERLDRHIAIVRVQHPVNLRPACMHQCC